jgi:hypothetical protein
VSSLVTVHAVSTLVLVGLIWTIQVVHYPLFAKVGESAFAEYHHAHTQRITLLVGPLMLAELATAVLLAVRPPSGIERIETFVGLALVVAIWATTFLVSVPLHAKLGRGFDHSAIRLLVATNWIRTALWSARVPLVVWWFWRI